MELLNLIPDSPSHLGFFETAAALPSFFGFAIVNSHSQSVRVNKYPSPFHRPSSCLPSLSPIVSVSSEWRERENPTLLTACVQASHRLYSLNSAAPFRDQVEGLRRNHCEFHETCATNDSARPFSLPSD